VLLCSRQMVSGYSLMMLEWSSWWETVPCWASIDEEKLRPPRKNSHPIKSVCRLVNLQLSQPSTFISNCLERSANRPPSAP